VEKPTVVDGGIKGWDRVDVVAKVGGSLYDLPELGSRLRAWLAELGPARVLLVPGGGATADVIREFDRCHALGEEVSHWLALHALTLNAHFLTRLLSRFGPGSARVQVLDAQAFVQADEGQPGCLAHCWEATSDSVAARVAVVKQAAELVLLKSVTVPEQLTWEEASRYGWVDSLFPQIIRQASGLRVRAVNLRDRYQAERSSVLG